MPAQLSPIATTGPRIAHLVALLFIASTCIAACTAGANRAAPADLPPDCDAFVTKYESCLKTTLPSLPQVAQQRAAQTRTALQQEADRAATSSAPRDAGEAAPLVALATKCHENLKRLNASCGAAPTAN